MPLPLFPHQYQLINQDDLDLMQDWLERLFTKYFNSKGPTVEEKNEGRALRSEFNIIYEAGIEEFEIEDMEEFWAKLELFNYGEEGTLARLQKAIVWSQWRQELEQVSDTYQIGEADCTLIYPQMDPTTIHEYRRRPAALKWRLLEIEQNDTKFYLATAPIKEIDAVCAVPDLPNSEAPRFSAQRILDPKKGVNEWQRQLNLDNRDAIRNFMDISTNIIANAPILFVSNEEYVSIEGSKLRISMDFLKKVRLNDPNREVYRDVHHGETGDLRPLWLIDGQHRIRGGAGSSKGREQNIPLIIFPSEMSLQRTAKIFAEINTLQRPLDVLHQIFMQHRFKIPSPKRKNDFAFNDGQPANEDSRANNIAYELAAKSCLDKKNPLFERIQIFDQNPGRGFVVDARKWVDFTRMWMKDFYSSEENYEVDNIYPEVRNYFQAIEALSTSSWPARGRKNLLQNKSPFIVLLLCFPAVRDKAATYFIERTGELPGPDNSIDKFDFQTAISPWRNLDWLNGDVLTTYRRGGEKPRRSLLAWLVDALKADEPARPIEILSNSIQGQPGKGLFASPLVSTAIVEGDGWLTQRGQKLRVYSQRPLNALPTCQWTLVDPRGDEIESKTSVADQNGRARCYFEHRAEWNVHGSLELRTRWENINGGTIGRKILSR
jgi:DGQHR domain-containing protein